MNGAPRDGGPRSATVGQRLSARLHKARPALPQPTYLVRRKHRNEHVVTQQRHRAKRRAAVDESKPESIHRYLEGGSSLMEVDHGAYKRASLQSHGNLRITCTWPHTHRLDGHQILRRAGADVAQHTRGDGPEVLGDGHRDRDPGEHRKG